MKRAALGSLVVVVLALSSAACAKSPVTVDPFCAPHDTLCQSQKASMGDPSCKNGTASNGKCLDPRAP